MELTQERHLGVLRVQVLVLHSETVLSENALHHRDVLRSVVP